MYSVFAEETKIGVTITPQYSAEDKQKEVEEFVQSAVELVKLKGKNSALSTFNKKDGQFTKGAKYIFAMDYTGKMLADGYGQELVGKNQLSLRDLDGKYINQDLIAKAKAGGGWVQYRWTNPITHLIECKKSFAQPMEGDYFIASGYYYAPNVDGKCAE